MAAYCVYVSVDCTVHAVDAIGCNGYRHCYYYRFPFENRHHHPHH
jgi:hypothetical protein